MKLKTLFLSAVLGLAAASIIQPLIPLLPYMVGAVSNFKPALPFALGLLGGLPLCGFTTSEIEEFRESLKDINQGVRETRSNYQTLAEKTGAIEKENAELRKQITALRKGQIAGIGRPLLRAGSVVSDDCARYIGAIFIEQCEIAGKLQSNPQREKLLELAREIRGIEQRSLGGVEQRSALTSTDIPMPTNYGAEVVELVWKYGQFRQYATVYPLGTLTAKLPKLSTDPAFGIIAQSATVTEKSPQIAFVTFTAIKSGGLIRLPSEIEADSIVPLGQFLARYIARQMAKWEDTWGFMADGSATYNSQSGVCKTADTLGNKIQLAATNSSPDKITLANVRTLRSKVDAATLATAAYYMHPSMESLLAGMNISANVTPYVPMGPNGPTLDGFPIRWVGVMPVNDTTAHLNQYQMAFGDLTYWYLGVRLNPDVQVSRDVFFATDEIALRALERFDIQLMANNAMGVLQLSAS